MKKEKKQLKPLTPEDFYRFREVSDARISPDGRMIVYTLQEVDRTNNTYKRSLWLVDTRSGKSRQFTSSPKGSDSMPRWSPSGDEIAFISSRSGKPQVWIISMQGGEARCSIMMPRGVEGFCWSPDGERIAFLSRMNQSECEEFAKSTRKKRMSDTTVSCSVEESSAEDTGNDPRLVDRIVYRTGTSYRDDRRHHIFTLTRNSGKIESMTSEDRDYSLPSWSPDSRFLYSSANFTGDEDNDVSTDIIRIDTATKEMTMVTTDIHENSQPIMSPDGRFIAFLSLCGEKLSCHNAEVKIIDLNNNELPRSITGFLDREVEQFFFSPDSSSIYCSVPDRGNVPIARISLFEEKAEWLTEGPHFVQDFDRDVAGSFIAYTLTSPERPSDIYLLNCEKGTSRRLTNTNAQLLKNRFVSIPEEEWWGMEDGLQVQGWVMKPQHFDPTHSYPAIVEIHGGPHVMWGNSFWLEFQIMAGRGYVVFFSNPRGSDGYGESFKKGIYQNWGIDDSRDILSGLETVIERGFIDRERLFITGGSYGGFMTAWIIGHDQRFRAAVAQRGVYNLTSFYGCSDAQLLIEWEFDTFPWDNPELLWRHSPLAYATHINTPLLIIHSDLDYRAPITTAEELFTALKKLKRKVLFVRYPREGHELSRSGEPKHRVDRLSRIVGWFDQHLQD